MNNKVQYFKSLLQRKTRTELLQVINDSPLKPSDIDFMTDCILQLSYKEMQNKYNMTHDGIYKRKCRCIETLYTFFFYQKQELS